MSTQAYDKQFVDALIQFSTEENDGGEYIRNLRKLAANQIGKAAEQGGGSFSIVSANLQGKSFSFQIERPAGQLFKECSEALRQFKNGSVTVSQTSWWGYWDLY